MTPGLLLWRIVLVDYDLPSLPPSPFPHLILLLPSSPVPPTHLLPPFTHLYTSSSLQQSRWIRRENRVGGHRLGDKPTLRVLGNGGPSNPVGSSRSGALLATTHTHTRRPCHKSLLMSLLIHINFILELRAVVKKKKKA